MAPEGQALGITVPLLSDSDHSVSEVYDVLQWAVGTGEPGHTFILVGTDGRIAWIQDYGAPENRGVMYVDPLEIAANVKAKLTNDLGGEKDLNSNPKIEFNNQTHPTLYLCQRRSA